MRSRITSWIVVWFMLSGIMTALPHNVEAKTIMNGDWDVFAPEIRVDDTIELKGNLTIYPGGSLTMRNVVLQFNQTSNLQFGASVLPGGVLYILDNSKVTSLNPSLRFKFSVQSGALITLSKSTIDRVGKDSNTGLSIRTTSATLKDSVISNSSVGLDINGVQLQMSGMFFYGNMLGARATSGANIIMTKSTVTKGITGVEIDSARITLDGSRLEKCNIGVSLNKSTADLRSSTISSHLQGILANASSHVTLTSATVTQNTITGISLSSGSELNGTSDTITTNPTAIQMSNSSYGTLRSSLLSGSTIDYSLSSSTLNLTDTTYASNRISLSGSSKVSVSWSFITRVINDTYLPVQGAKVTIAHVGLNYSWNGTTNAAGYTSSVPLLSCSVNTSGTHYFGDYSIVAEYQGAKNSTVLNITKTTVITLIVYSAPPPLSLISIDAEMRSAVVTWVGYQGKLFYSYSVFLSTVNGSVGNLVREVRNQGTAYTTIPSLKPDSTYYVSVRLLFTDGRFSFGPQKNFRTLAEYPYPHHHLGPIDLPAGSMNLSGGSYFVNGNITVHGTGFLQIFNATVIMNNTVPLQYKIRSMDAGSIQSERSILISKSTFSMEISASLSLKDTQVLNLTGQGIFITSNSTSFTDVTFMDSGSAITTEGVSVSVVRSAFLNVSKGMDINGGSAYLSNITIANSSSPLSIDLGGYAVIKGAWISGCDGGIAINGSTPVFAGMNITSCKYALNVTGSKTGVIKDLNVSGAIVAVKMVRSNIDLLSGSISSSDTAVSISSGSPRMDSMQIRGNRIGIYASNASMSIANGIIASHQTGILGSNVSLSVAGTQFSENDASMDIKKGEIVANGISIVRTDPKTLKSDIRAFDANLTIASSTIMTESDAISATDSDLKLDRLSVLGARTCMILERSSVNMTASALRSAMLYGVRASFSNVWASELTIANVMLSGMSLVSSTVTIVNSTVSSIGPSAELSNSGLFAVASVIDTTKVSLTGSSLLQVSWFLSVSVFDGDSIPQTGVTIEIYANGTFVGKHLTNSKGVVQWVEVPVEKLTIMGRNVTNPILIRASRWNVSMEQVITMNANAYPWFVMNQPPKPINATLSSVTESSITVTWKPVGPGELTKVDVLYRRDNQTNWTIKGPYSPIPVPIIVKNLTSNTSYVVKLRGYNRDLVHQDSNEVPATTLKPNHAPEISDIQVPTTAYENDPIHLQIAYSDADGDKPEYVRAWIAGSFTNMIKSNGSKYIYNTTLVKGTYSIFFEVSDGRGMGNSIVRSANYTITVTTRSSSSLTSNLLQYAPWGVLILAVIILILIRKRVASIFVKKGKDTEGTEPETIGSPRHAGMRTIERPLAKKYRVVAETHHDSVLHEEPGEAQT